MEAWSFRVTLVGRGKEVGDLYPWNARPAGREQWSILEEGPVARQGRGWVGGGLCLQTCVWKERREGQRRWKRDGGTQRGEERKEGAVEARAQGPSPGQVLALQGRGEAPAQLTEAPSLGVKPPRVSVRGALVRKEV